MRRKRKNRGGTRKCTNCQGAGYRYEKIRDLGGRSGSGVADTFRVTCDACRGKGYTTQKDRDENYARIGHNPRRYRRNSKRSMQVWDKHQLKIARATLKMSDVGARIMGGMTKAEARAVIMRLTGRKARSNPRLKKSSRRRRRNCGCKRSR